MEKQKNSILGIISLVMGIFGISISIIIYWALWSYINDKFVRMVSLQIQILNTLGIIEVIIKPLALLLSIIGVFQKHKRLAFIALIVNVIVLLWTIALYSGWII